MPPPSPLITKYRPRDFDEVVGHVEVMGTLQRAMASDSHPHAYLITGISGLGKTTIARIIAKTFDAEVLEVDAASHSKVEEMRELVETAQHMSLSGAGVRLFLIDEAHRLSANAWDALLKVVEEPPPHLYIALCTTNLGRVPTTIQTRCYHVRLLPLRRDDMEMLLSTIAAMEQWKVNADVMAAVIRAAEGSPRQGLTLLQSVHDAESVDEVRRVIQLRDAADPLNQIVRLLLKGRTNWGQVQRLLSRVRDDEYEESLIGLGRYCCAVMLQAESEAAARRAWSILEALVYPATSYDRKAVLYAAIGRLVWSDE